MTNKHHLYGVLLLFLNNKIDAQEYRLTYEISQKLDKNMALMII